ncbi:hypothetical protein SDJN02_15259, partial [Cucurbita argyrosperma subsp. argyrosperma]
MEDSRKLLRRSVYSFLQNYQFFTSIAAVLAFPYAISVLLSQTVLPSSSLFSSAFDHFRALFDAAGFPISSKFFSILIQKLSQTVVSSIYSLPFSLTFLLISKACVIQALNQQKPSLEPSFSSIMSLFNPLLVTHVCNSFVFVSVNATVFFLLFFAFNCLQGFGFFFSPNWIMWVSVFGAFLYSIAIAKAIIICNLASVLSGMERKGGFMAILKAWVLIQGRSATALLVALPFNMGMAGIEALFQYRIVGGYHSRERLGGWMVVEGMFVAYLYSVFVVLDAIVNTMFFKSYRMGYGMCLERKRCVCCWMDVGEKEGEGGWPPLEGL